MDELICGSCHGHLSVKPAACPLCGEDPRVDGRYWLERVLGSGASGTTFLASEEAEPSTQVAIKELSVRALHSFKALDLFERETAVLRSLRHPAIPAYVEHFHLQSGKQVSLYLVQEFIQGHTLEEELKSERFDEAQLVAILGELLDVLEYLHQCAPAVIHRDIKPSNIMRRQADGRLALIDFGAVREVVKDPELGGSTVAGTFGYMAPEQFAGVALPATDLYGLGVTLLTLLTRRQPQEMLDAHHVLQWRSHTHASERMLRVLERLLEPDYKLRASSASQVRELLSELPERSISPSSHAQPMMHMPRRGSNEGQLYVEAQLFKWLSKRFHLLHPSLALDPVMIQRLRDVSAEVVSLLWRGQDAQVNLPFFTANAQGPIHFQLTLCAQDLEHIVRVDEGFELERYQPSATGTPSRGELMVRPHAGGLVQGSSPGVSVGIVLVVLGVVSSLSLVIFLLFLLGL